MKGEGVGGVSSSHGGNFLDFWGTKTRFFLCAYVIQGGPERTERDYFLQYVDAITDISV